MYMNMIFPLMKELIISNITIKVSLFLGMCRMKKIKMLSQFGGLSAFYPFRQPKNHTQISQIAFCEASHYIELYISQIFY